MIPQLAYPTALALGALAIPIVIFYILKIRLRREPVATIMFWNQIFEEKKPRSLWQKLRHLISLLLQLAFLALLVFAIAEPFFSWERGRARRIVIVIDQSASMNATDIKPTRLDRAKDEAIKLIDAMRFRDEAAIIAAGNPPRVYSGLTDHQRTLRDAVQEIRAADGPTTVPQAVELARRLVVDHDNKRIIIISDGGFVGSTDMLKDESIAAVAVGGATTNVGITRFQARRSLVDPIGYEILVEAMNGSNEPVERRLEIDLAGEPVDVVPLKLAAGEKWTRVFEKTSAEGGILKAFFDKPDSLAADDSAWAILPKREYQRVILSTFGNLFLEKVFEAIPLVKLTVVKEIAKATEPGAILAFHRAVPAVIPKGRVIVIEPDRSTDLWDRGEAIAAPIVAKHDKDSPLMAHVRLDNVMMPEARKLSIKGKYTSLAESATGDPLYALIRRPEGDVLVITVNLDKSDLPLQTAFPILTTNASAYFAGEKGELKESIAAGSVADVSIPDIKANEQVSLVAIAPDGAMRDLPPAANGKITIGPLDRSGVWSVVKKPQNDERVKGSEKRSAPVAQVACNLADRRETDLRPAADWSTRRVDIARGFGGRPVWYYLIATAWILTAWEWFLYQRRWID